MKAPRADRPLLVPPGCRTCQTVSELATLGPASAWLALWKLDSRAEPGRALPARRRPSPQQGCLLGMAAAVRPQCSQKALRRAPGCRGQTHPQTPAKSEQESD